MKPIFSNSPTPLAISELVLRKIIQLVHCELYLYTQTPRRRRVYQSVAWYILVWCCILSRLCRRMDIMSGVLCLYIVTPEVWWLETNIALSSIEVGAYFCATIWAKHYFLMWVFLDFGHVRITENNLCRLPQNRFHLSTILSFVFAIRPRVI